MSRLRVIVVSVCCLVAASVPATGPATARGGAAADPPGTIVLATGPSTTPQRATVLAATAQAVVYAGDVGLVVQPVDGSSPTVLTPSGAVESAAGSLVLYDDYSDDTRRWFDTATATGGVAPAEWTSAAPTGGLVVQQVTSTSVRVSVEAIGSSTPTLLANVAHPDPDDIVSVVSGPAGAVVSYHPGFGRNGPSYLGYVAYAGGGLRSYGFGSVTAADQDFFTCAAPSSTTVACLADASTNLFAVPISGTTAAPLVASTHAFDGVRVSSSVIAWQAFANGASQASLRSVPVAGGAVTTSKVPAVSTGFASNETGFFEHAGTPPARSGVYRTPDAATAPTPVAVLGAVPLQASQLAITPGARVVYEDDRRSPNAIWQQTLSRTPGGVTAGSSQLLVTAGASSDGLSISGARTSYDTGSAYKVVSPLQPTVTRADQPRLSGTRAVVTPFTASGGSTIVDLNTGTSSATSAFGDDGLSGALTGDFFVFAKADGSVWRKNLTTTAAATRLLPAPASSPYAPGIAAWGDWVAVTRTNARFVRAVTVLDVRHGTRRQDTGYATHADAAGYVVDGVTLHSWDGTRAVTIEGFGLVATASILSWIGSDGRVRAAPVPWTVPDPPRSLGNPLAPATVAANSTWTFDLPTSAPLTSCSVDLLKGTTVVRTLACDAAYTGGGDAVVRWDTKNASGGAAPLGVYAWRVNASNADGPLQLGTGAAGVVSGKVTLTRAV